MGRVFQDLDGNGIQDVFSGETVLVDWTVQLYWKATGELLMSTSSTDALSVPADYVFEGLGNGDYIICIVANSGYQQTAPLGKAVCGGLGHEFTLNGSFETWAMGNDFAEMPIP